MRDGQDRCGLWPQGALEPRGVVFTSGYCLSSPALFNSRSTPDPSPPPHSQGLSLLLLDNLSLTPGQAFGGRGHPRLGPERGSVGEVAGWGLSPEPQLVAATLILKTGHWVPWGLGAGHGGRELASSAAGRGCWRPQRSWILLGAQPAGTAGAGPGFSDPLLLGSPCDSVGWSKGPAGRQPAQGSPREGESAADPAYCPAWGGTEPQLPK